MDYVKVIEHSNFVEVVLNRPDSRNAFHPQMIEEITQAFNKISQSTVFRFALLRGEGKAFCSGADLNWMRSMVDYSKEENISDSLKLHEMFESLASCWLPIVTLVHGHVMGGALGLIAASDIVLSHADTQFCFSEVRLGLIPAVISEFVLRKSKNHSLRAYMISGEMFDAKKAHHLHLITEITDLNILDFSNEDFLKNKWTVRMLENGPEAMREIKKLLSEIEIVPPGQIKTLTTAAISERRVSAEGQDGLRSFLEKRQPLWRKN